MTSSTNEQEKQSQAAVNVLTPVQIPEGPTLFILESESVGTPSQVLAMATKQLPNQGALSHSHQTKNLRDRGSGKHKIRNSNQNNRKSILSSKNSKQGTVVHETYLFNQNSVVSIEDDTATQQFFCCDLCSSNAQSVHYQSYKELIKHYLVTHRLRLLKQASAACREDNCSFKVKVLRTPAKTRH